MPSKKPLSDNELEAWEASRDIAAELEISVREMLAGQGTEVSVSPVVSARMKSGLTQARFASLLGVSIRTLQEWEQGRRQPSGAAKTLIAIAQKRPEALNELAGQDDSVV
jgi:putative transcriptional regulator